VLEREFLPAGQSDEFRTRQISWQQLDYRLSCFLKELGEGTRGPNCKETRRTISRAVVVPKWAQFVSHCKFGNLGQLGLEKTGPKMTR
jgi:hypothetical protein